MSAEYNSQENRVKLCCGATNCPEVSLENDKVRIDDDYGNHIILDHAQASLIQEALILVRSKAKK